MKRNPIKGWRGMQKVRKVLPFVLIGIGLLSTMAVTACAENNDPLAAIENLSSFLFSAIQAIGVILLLFGVVQIGIAVKGHDASQRANGFLTVLGGIIITFAKPILDMVLS